MELIAKKYKQTEVGLIPSDWDVKHLQELTGFITKGSTPTTYGFKWELNGILFLRSECVSDNGLDLSKSMFISDEANRILNRSEIKSNDILITITGNVGRVIYLNDNFGIANINQHIAKVRIEKPNVNRLFIYHYLSQPEYQKYFNSIVTGQAYPQISLKQVRDALVPIPTFKEQTAIATALSDADALITSLEKLIAKKRNIKQGAMQKLLQPKEGWETKTLKELTRYRRGSFPQPYGLDKWYDETNGFPFVQVFDVDDNFKLKSETKRRISKEAQDMSVYIAKGSVIITLQGSIGRIAITQYDAYVDRTLLFFESFIVPFDKYFFLLSIFNLFEKEKEKAPGGIIKTITKEALSRFTISYPKIEEQTRIATILSDMDAEISALETKLEKYSKVKLGMMQNLLTGKIRLN